jgi:hypothetical protein
MPKSFEHYMIVKKGADVELVHSKLDWVILRPSALTDDPGTGNVSLSPAEIHTEISRDDVAATGCDSSPLARCGSKNPRSNRRQHHHCKRCHRAAGLARACGTIQNA